MKVAGTACTTKYTPDPKDPVNAEYLRRWLYPEVLVRNTIQRYWQQGMIGSQNLTGPDADLGARFLNGQAVNLKLPDLTKIQQNAPAGAVWCTYQDNKQVCGRSPTSPARPATSSPPPKPNTAPRSRTPATRSTPTSRAAPGTAPPPGSARSPRPRPPRRSRPPPTPPC